MEDLGARDRLFELYERGVITATETRLQFVELMIAAPDEDAAVALCAGLPDWFRDQFRDWLTDMATCDYRYRWFAMGGHPRTKEEIEADADRHQAFLKRTASRILETL